MEGHSVLLGAQMQPSAQAEEGAQRVVYLHRIDSVHRTRLYLKRGPRPRSVSGVVVDVVAPSLTVTFLLPA